MNRNIALPVVPIILWVIGAPCYATLAEDRAAVERVYHEHRIGNKAPFEEAMPESLIVQLVERDQHKERVLQKEYGITITDAQIESETNRIDASTRAPDMLEEIKAALGNDPDRFADTVVRPLLVERMLRNRYETDHKRNAETRKAAESIRERLLAAMPAGLVEQLRIVEESGYQTNRSKWKLIPRSEGEIEQLPSDHQIIPIKSTASGGLYKVESTVQTPQVLSSPEHEPVHEFYFEDLHPQLQKVLNVQLQEPGSVSAVIERPTGFHLYMLIDRTATEMEVSALTLPKYSYDKWLEEQPVNP